MTVLEALEQVDAHFEQFVTLVGDSGNEEMLARLFDGSTGGLSDRLHVLRQLVNEAFSATEAFGLSVPELEAFDRELNYFRVSSSPDAFQLKRAHSTLQSQMSLLRRQLMSSERSADKQPERKSNARGTLEAPGAVEADAQTKRPGAEGSISLPKPRVFIGSSAESLQIVRALCQEFEYDFTMKPWTGSVFGPSSITVNGLLEQTRKCNFAIFVIDADDTAIVRGEPKNLTRDNVVFELGLFMGALGLDHCFIVYDRKSPPDVASDLNGVTPVTYAIDDDGDISSSLTGPAHRIRTQIQHAWAEDHNDS